MLPESQLIVTGLCITHLRLHLQLHSMAVVSGHWEKLLDFISILGNAIQDLHWIRGCNLDGCFGAFHCFHSRQTTIIPYISKSKALLTSD